MQQASYHERFRRREQQATRTTVLINLGIEVFSALVLAVGIGSVGRFLLLFRNRMEPGQFRNYALFLGGFALVWGVYIARKLLRHIRLLREVASDQAIPPPTPPLS